MTRSPLCRINDAMERVEDELLKRDPALYLNPITGDLEGMDPKKSTKVCCEVEKLMAGMTWEEVEDVAIGVAKRLKNGGSWENEVEYIKSGLERRLKEQQQQ